MSRVKILLFLLLTLKLSWSQTNVYRDTIPVFESNNRLLMPWAGGINFSSFTSTVAEQLLKNEVNILKELDHENVVKCLDVFKSKNNCYIVTELY